jgi:ATP-dependent RNA helicase DHX37/DHR1
VGRDTLIKFMTDGVLLREIQQDFILSKYRAVIIDEAHERSVNTDLLIGMLSRIAPLRAELAKEEPDKHRPLKLIIMSATLSQGVDSFLKNVRLWNRSGGLPPVVEAEGRQYPVTVHFARRTRRDFLTEIVEKVAKGHRKLPAGGMLVFLTGQQEIWTVARKLREKLGGAGSGVAASAITDRRSGGTDDYEDDRDVQNERDFLEGEEHQDSDSEAEIRMDDEEDAEFDIQDAEARPQATSGNRAPLKPHILPLYAALPANQQLKVFQAPPHGHRSIILATNVAETSLTIPGVRYVFDSGRVKEKRYDTSTGIQTFEVDWISKASAEQRKGRAGRTGPGHVWRLYSSNVYEEFFADETVPEILRTPLESIVLQLKAMEIENVINFPFPTPPERHQLEIAERLLINLGAIEKSSGSVTKTGKEIMRFPVSPRFGKMLMLAQTNNNVAHVVAVVAALAVGDLIVPEVQSATHGLEDGEGSEVSDDDNESGANVKRNDAAAKAATDEKHQAYTRAQAQLARWDDKSDVMKLLVATALHAEAQNTGAANLSPSDRCQQFSLREKGMEEVQLLRRQLHNIIGREFSSILPQLSTKEINILNQVVAAGFVDQVAIRADLLKEGAVGRKPRRANEVPYRTLFPSTDAVAINQSASPQEDEVRRSVYIHPSSVLAKLSVREVPQYIIYSHLSRGAPSTSNGTLKRTRIHPLTAIGPKALAALAEGTSLLQIGKPINKIEDLPRSEKGKQRRQCWVGLGLKAPGSTSREWPLGAWKVIQWRGTRDWELEKVLAR